MRWLFAAQLDWGSCLRAEGVVLETQAWREGAVGAGLAVLCGVDLSDHIRMVEQVSYF